MGTSDTHSLLSSMQIFILCLSCNFTAKVEALNNKKVSGFYVFGDSTVDPGNNNYIHTPFRSNFPPYGRDFANHVPTGRFTNGKLVTDYVGNYLINNLLNFTIHTWFIEIQDFNFFFKKIIIMWYVCGIGCSACSFLCWSEERGSSTLFGPKPHQYWRADDRS